MFVSGHAISFWQRGVPAGEMFDQIFYIGDPDVGRGQCLLNGVVSNVQGNSVRQVMYGNYLKANGLKQKMYPERESERVSHRWRNLWCQSL